MFPQRNLCIPPPANQNKLDRAELETIKALKWNM